MEDVTQEEINFARCIVNNFEAINQRWNDIERRSDILTSLLGVSLMVNLFLLLSSKFRAAK